MKTITIITEQLSDEALTAILPTSGIASVTVTEDPSTDRADVTVSDFHSFRNPNRFHPNYRIDVILDEATVDTLFDSITVAYAGGFFGDSEAWVNVSAPAA